MKKLSLMVDDIAVSSFTTDEYEDVRGTVDGNEATKPYVSCVHICGTVRFGPGDDECTSGCVCCRFRAAPKPKI